MQKSDIHSNPTYQRILELLEHTNEAELTWICIFIEAYLRNK